MIDHFIQHARRQDERMDALGVVKGIDVTPIVDPTPWFMVSFLNLPFGVHNYPALPFLVFTHNGAFSSKQETQQKAEKAEMLLTKPYPRGGAFLIHEW